MRSTEPTAAQSGNNPSALRVFKDGRWWPWVGTVPRV